MAKLTKSPVVGLPVAALMAASLAGCAGQSPATSGVPGASTSGAGPAAGGQITIEGGTGKYGDCLKSQYYDPFAASTGISVVLAPQGDGSLTPAKLAQQTRTYQIDVGSAGFAGDVEADGAQYLEPIDYSVVPKDELYPGFALTYGAGVPPNAIAFGYNPTFVKNKPQRIEDFFDPAGFPGKRGIVAVTDPDVLAIALIASGVAPDKVVPFDYDRAFAELDKIKSDIIWAQSGTQARQLFDAGEAPMELTFSSRYKESVDAGKSAEVVWDGFSVYVNYWYVPKGDPNKDAAMKFLAYVESKDVNGKLSDCVAVGTSNSLSKVNADMAPYVPSAHLDGRYVNLNTPDALTWVAEHAEEIHDKFEAWKTN